MKKGVLSGTIICLVVAGALCAGYLVTKKLVLAEYELQIEELKTQVEINTRAVYVANEDIEAGKTITNDMLRIESHLISQSVGLFTEGDIGKKALVGIPKGAVMYAAYGAERVDESSSREVEYTCMYLSSSLEQGDYIDVRIRFQNGEDFSVLSKKQIEKLSIPSKSCHLIVNDVDLQRMASAIIDTNEYNAVIYCVEYTMPSVQEATAVTYPARSETLSALYSSNNGVYSEWMSKRGELEIRLNTTSKEISDPVDISNFTSDKGKEQSNTNDAGAMSTLKENNMAE